VFQDNDHFPRIRGVSGSEGNKMAEAFRRHRITIVYERADGLFEAANSRHTREAEQTRFHSAETASESERGARSHIILNCSSNSPKVVVTVPKT
jgi:hypothetical protein